MEILGQSHGENPDKADVRAKAYRVCDVSVGYEGGAIGAANVQIFKSEDCQDRGGVAIRLTIRDVASSLVPSVRVLNDGLEIHLAGDSEADSMLSALEYAIKKYRDG